MKLHEDWWLGFLGLAGVWTLPAVLAFFHGTGWWFDLLHLFWFAWFPYWIPENVTVETR